MDADDCARIVEGVAAVLDLLAAGGDAVDDPAPIYELLAERCHHVRVGDECRGADQSGHRVAAGNRLAVSGASVSARLTPCRRGGSDICGRDMKMAATVFRWRPSWRVFACCRLYAFLSARRS